LDELKKNGVSTAAAFATFNYSKKNVVVNERKSYNMLNKSV